MKNNIIASAAFILIILWAVPAQVASAETDPKKLLESLNNKTAEIKTEQVSVMKEESSYVFSVEKEMIKIKFKEIIRSYLNKEYLNKNEVVGTITIDDAAKIDPQELLFDGKYLQIVCQKNEKCMARETITTEYNAKGEITIGPKSRKHTASRFRIPNITQPLANQIIKDLKALFALVVPPDEPEPAD